jgi:hypothetical protein
MTHHHEPVDEDLVERLRQAEVVQREEQGPQEAH